MAVSRLKYVDINGERPGHGSWDGMRIGSEFCAQLLPYDKHIQSLSRVKDPGCLTLVTPITGPDEIDGVMRTVKAAVLEGWSEIVVNDWGVLSGLADLAAQASAFRTGITAGRLLMRFRRGPGIHDLSAEYGEGPDLTIRRYFAWGPLYDSPFLAFLKASCVDRIELDLPRCWEPVPDMADFRFSFHKSTRLISVTGLCPWLYDPEKGAWGPAGGCARPCRDKNDIVMNAPALKKPLYLRGRAIYERVETDTGVLELPDRVDRIIYDGGSDKI